MKAKDRGYVEEHFAGMYISRPYDESLDGWMDEQLSARDVPSLSIAQDIVLLFREVNALRRENWELRKEVEQWKSACIPHLFGGRK